MKGSWLATEKRSIHKDLGVNLNDWPVEASNNSRSGNVNSTAIHFNDGSVKTECLLFAKNKTYLGGQDFTYNGRNKETHVTVHAHHPHRGREKPYKESQLKSFIRGMLKLASAPTDVEEMGFF